ncbi:MAG: hypothetical protein GY810_29765 [Aureispira sp.]|nr:hypothetical protein [Aureispira sp.]
MHNQFHSNSEKENSKREIVLQRAALNNKDLRLLEDQLQENEKAGKYHLSLGITIIIFSWFWYFALPGIASLVWAIIASVAIWLYPYIFMKKAKELRLVLKSGEKVFLENILIEDRKKVAISRLHHEYKLVLNGKAYTTSQHVFNSFLPDLVVDIEVVEPANILLSIKKSKQNG